MCGLCGILGDGGHWTDSATTPAVFAARPAPETRGRERQTRTRLINQVLKHYGLSLKDWGGNAYVLSNRTGGRAIVDNLTELWPAAERLGRQPCDPLDHHLVAALRR